MSSKQDAVLQFIREHPGSSTREIHTSLFPEVNPMTNAKTAHQCALLKRYGLIRNEIEREWVDGHGFSVNGDRRYFAPVARWYPVHDR